MKPLIYDLIKGKIEGYEHNDYENLLWELFPSTYNPNVSALKISDDPNVRIYNLIHSSKSGDGCLNLYPDDFTGLIFMITKIGGSNGLWRVLFRDTSGEEYMPGEEPGTKINTDTWYIIEKRNDDLIPPYRVRELSDPAILMWKAPEYDGPVR